MKIVVGLNPEWIDVFYLLTGNIHIVKAIPHDTKKQETLKSIHMDKVYY